MNSEETNVETVIFQLAQPNLNDYYEKASIAEYYQSPKHSAVEIGRSTKLEA